MDSVSLKEFARLIEEVKGQLIYQRWLGLGGQRFFKLAKSAKPAQPPGATLAGVREELGECRRCKLHMARKKIVFGVGNESADIVLVGEGPGRDEDIQGEPFVGRAGGLLTKILAAIDLKREQVYITNVVKCRPPGNRDPQLDEISSCEPFLDKQLKVISPAFIVTLGSFAARTLLKTEEKISSLRGRFYDYSGIRLLPTYHPAFILRNPNMKRPVWEDFQLVEREYQAFLKGR